ncbi:MAG: hypothetical protein ACOX78_00855 [Lachnospiraceae bacterium]|jgi:tetratricopeptide (TPR) repeat protein
MNEENLRTALQTIDALEQMEDGGESLRENSTSVTLSFDHVMEYYLYIWYFPQDKEIHFAGVPYSSYYLEAGNEKLKEGKPHAAVKYFRKAQLWNPVSLPVKLAFAEALKQENKLKPYLDKTQEAHRYCLTRAEMARYFRNVGFYYVEKYRPDIARACYIRANRYFHSENADLELKYLETALKDKTPEMTDEQIDSLLRENDIFTGPDETSVQVVAHAGFDLIRTGQTREAADCLEVASDISGDESMKRLVKKLRG